MEQDAQWTKANTTSLFFKAGPSSILCLRLNLQTERFNNIPNEKQLQENKRSILFPGGAAARFRKEKPKRWTQAVNIRAESRDNRA